MLAWSDCVRRPNSGIGLIAEVGSGAPVVVLRSDIDALPIKEIGSAKIKCAPLPEMTHAGQTVSVTIQYASYEISCKAPSRDSAANVTQQSSCL